MRNIFPRAGHTIASLQRATLAYGLCTVAVVFYKLSPPVSAGWGWCVEGGDAVLGITFTGVSWRWKKISSAWFAGAAFFCVRTSARCWFCLLSLVICELLRDDVAWDVGSKKDLPWSFCESDWDCHAKASTALSNSRERREMWWCLSFKGLSAVDMCPDEMF